MSVIDFAGIWQLHNAARNITVDYPVPGDVHSALIAAGQIPHPYKGTNELAVRWVADEEWVATRSFELDAIDDGEYHLDIDYLDTVATVKVNGIEVLQAENCFRRYTPGVTKALKTGENTVEVTLHSNTKSANEKQAAQPFYIPYSVSNNPIPNGNMLRKPQCHFGWDWNLAVVPFGLCGRFEVIRQSDTRIENITVTQRHSNEKYRVFARIELHSTVAGVGDLQINFAGERINAAPDLRLGKNEVVVSFDATELARWWPAGQGEQILHELVVICGSQVERRNVGVREIELITDKQDKGARFGFRVNGREIFCKGANWIPVDALPSNATPELARKLLQAAKDANMNMIRVWGGGYYEQDFFYDICDELGLLVWQDFMFACSLYPSTPEFIAEVRLEAEYQVKRLQHHACLALWCGDNELIGALTWFEEPRKNRDRYLVNYDRLNRALEEVVHAADYTAIWWPSSPSPGLLDFGDTWHDDSKGDMHFWSVWHEGRDFEHYYDVKPRFCSEFGFQSFPSLRLIKEFSTSEEDLNISSAVMEHHQRNKGGNARIAETMFRNFRFPMDFGNFVYLSQVQHGLAMKMAVEYWRSLKPHCLGTLYWQLNDTWPVASWSGLDHGGSWKLMHYMARRFYAPILFTARKFEDQFIVSAVNDLPTDFETTIEVEMISIIGVKSIIYSKHVKLNTNAGQEVSRVKLSDIPKDHMLFLSWTDEHGITQRNHASPVAYKHLNLPNSDLKFTAAVEDATLSIKISAQHLSLYVTAECDVAGHFSDSAFDLLSGETRTIHFTPDIPSGIARAKETLVIRDLYSSSH